MILLLILLLVLFGGGGGYYRYSSWGSRRWRWDLWPCCDSPPGLLPGGRSACPSARALSNVSMNLFGFTNRPRRKTRRAEKSFLITGKIEKKRSRK